MHRRVFLVPAEAAGSRQMYAWQREDKFSLSSSVYLSRLVEPKYNYWILIIASPRDEIYNGSDRQAVVRLRKKSIFGFILHAARTEIMQSL